MISWRMVGVCFAFCIAMGGCAPSPDDLATVDTCVPFDDDLPTVQDKVLVAAKLEAAERLHGTQIHSEIEVSGFSITEDRTHGIIDGLVVLRGEKEFYQEGDKYCVRATYEKPAGVSEASAETDSAISITSTATPTPTVTFTPTATPSPTETPTLTPPPANATSDPLRYIVGPITKCLERREDLDAVDMELLDMARREAAEYLFGAEIRSTTVVSNSVVTSDQIVSVVTGHISVVSRPKYDTRSNQRCISVEFFTTSEERSKLIPKRFDAKVCRSTEEIPQALIKETTLRLAELEVARKYAGSFHSADEARLLGLLRDIDVVDDGFVEDSNLWCTTVSATIDPLIADALDEEIRQAQASLPTSTPTPSPTPTITPPPPLLIEMPDHQSSNTIMLSQVSVDARHYWVGVFRSPNCRGDYIALTDLGMPPQNEPTIFSNVPLSIRPDPWHEFSSPGHSELGGDAVTLTVCLLEYAPADDGNFAKPIVVGGVNVSHTFSLTVSHDE